MRLPPEPEILMGLRGFPDAQLDLAGSALSQWPGIVDVSWYDTAIRPEVGSFAVVRDGGPMGDLVGEILRIVYGERSVFVYCIGASDVPTDLALARRAFLALDVLNRESISVLVQVIE